jgi:hypothetical protein
MVNASSSAHLRAPGRSFPVVPPPSRQTASSEEETWREKFTGALPLLLVGAACTAVAAELYSTGNVTLVGENASVRLRPWVLFVALGITGISAGVFALLFEGPEGLSVPPEVSRAWSRSTPDWDESSLEPEPRRYARRRTWETSAEMDGNGPGDSVWSDVALHQIDEIERALRKSGRSPPNEEVRS